MDGFLKSMGIGVNGDQRANSAMPMGESIDARLARLEGRLNEVCLKIIPAMAESLLQLSGNTEVLRKLSLGVYDWLVDFVGDYCRSHQNYEADPLPTLAVGIRMGGPMAAEAQGPKYDTVKEELRRQNEHLSGIVKRMETELDRQREEINFLRNRNNLAQRADPVVIDNTPKMTTPVGTAKATKKTKPKK